MTDINIFAPPPDTTLDRIVAANRPRIIASLRRHWWQRFTSTKRFTLLSGFTLFAAGALVSAAVLVPQLQPGHPNFTIDCYNAEGTVAQSLEWGGRDVPANDSTLTEAESDPARQCVNLSQGVTATTLLQPVAQSLAESGYSCGLLQARTGQVFGFIADRRDPESVTMVMSQVGDPAFAGCRLFKEPVDIPVLGILVPCRASATVAAVYPAGDESQITVCQAHKQPIWSGAGR